MLVRPGRLMGRGSGAFSPLTLDPFIWLDPSDLSTLFQDSAMTTPVTTDSDPVGAILDKSGNGHHATQVTAGSRPLYRTAGGLHWLEFDGTNDFLAITSSDALPFDALVAIRFNVVDTDQALLSTNAGHKAMQLRGGLLSMWHGGSDFDSTFEPDVDTDFVWTSRSNGASSRIALDNEANQTGNPGASAWAGLSHLGRNGATQSESVNIRLYGLFHRPQSVTGSLLTDPEIAQLRTYLAGKQGRVL